MSISKRFQLLLIVTLIISVYYSAIFSPPCYIDDNKLIYYDAADLAFGDTLSIIFSNGGYYRPLLFLTYILDSYLWMLHESFMHLENVLLHLGNTLLIYAITEQLLKLSNKFKPTTPIPLAAAMLFGLNPLATESVNWISGRTDPLATLFILMSLSLLLRWYNESTFRLLLLSQFSFLIAALSKETAIFYYPAGLILMMILTIGNNASNVAITWQSVKNSIYKQWPAYIASTVTVIAYFAMRKFAAYTPGSKDKGMVKVTSYLMSEKQDSSWFDKILEVFKTIGFYTKKLFIPWPLNFTIHKVSDWYALFGLLAIVMLVTFCWRRKDLIAALFLSAFMVASSAILVSVGKLAWTLYAERYLYIALVFFCPGVVMLVYEKLQQSGRVQFFRPVIIVICGLFLVTTFSRNLIWMNGFALYEDCYKKSPDFSRAMQHYAAALIQDGRVHEGEELRKKLPKKTVAKSNSF